MSEQTSLSEKYRQHILEILPKSGPPEPHRLIEDLTKQSLSNLKTDFEYMLWKLSWVATYYRLGEILANAARHGLK